jgi:hypothetical protein
MTPTEQVAEIIAKNEAIDPDFYADPDKPTVARLQAAIPMNEARAYSNSSNSRFSVGSNAWRRYGRTEWPDR